MRGDAPNNRITGLISPDSNSPRAVLLAHVAGWSLLCALWISWQFWGGGDGLRRLLMAALALLSLVQALKAYGLLRRRRDRTPPPSR